MLISVTYGERALALNGVNLGNVKNVQGTD